MEEYEDDIISLYVNSVQNKKKEFCTKISGICNENYIVDDEDEDDDNDEMQADFDIDRDEL